MSYLELSPGQVAWAALLILINGAASVLLRLGLEKSLLVASLRTIVQLTLVGFVLQWVFDLRQPILVVAVIVFMTCVAGVTAATRLKRRYPWVWLTTLVSIAASAWLVGGYAMVLVFPGVEPWYQPQYLIPLVGMVLGNSLNGVSIGLDSLLESLVSQRLTIEMRLALGASRWEAARPVIQQAVRAGMIPIVNSMMVVGLVSLPGMMTGQLLAGASPVEAVKYQIVIMFLIAAATAMGTVGVVLLGFLRHFNDRHQLDLSALIALKR